MIVVSGPSGAGKSSVVAGLADRVPFTFSVSMTTRDRRPGEANGVDYLFVSPAEFDRAVQAGDLIESAEYGGNLYGTPARALEQARSSGQDVLLDIEIVGAGLVKERFPEAIMVWIDAPDRSELERRLRSRGDTSDADVARRLAVADEHSRRAQDLFDHFLVNDDLTTAVDRLTDILGPVPEFPEDES